MHSPRTRTIFTFIVAPRGRAVVAAIVLAGSLLALPMTAGCKNALRQDADAELQRSLDATIARESGSALSPGSGFEAVAESSSVFESLKGRRQQLDAMGPQASNTGVGLDVGPDLDGKAPREVILTLQQAVSSCVQN
ncbi:MAG: hypothetical protein EBR07_01680, partial [Planctomycetes bacterium]|nr:hypothetical protein [Planctomycetota bacterium]